MGNWIKITNNSIPKHKVLVTNNIEAIDANGQMSHVWIAEVGVNKCGKSYSAFINLPSTEEVYSLTHYCEIPKP